MPNKRPELSRKQLAARAHAAVDRADVGSLEQFLVSVQQDRIARLLGEKDDRYDIADLLIQNPSTVVKIAEILSKAVRS